MSIEETKIRIARELSRDIKELKQKKRMIENLEIKPVTMEEWQKLCRTPLRYDDLLLEVAKATFPQGTNFYRYANEVTFEINGIVVNLPTSVSEILTIDMRWYIGYSGYYPQFKCKHPNMKRYFNLLDSGKYSWYDLAKCRNPHEKNKFSLFIWWFTRGVWHKVDRNKWIEAFEREEQSFKELMERRAARKIEVEKQLNNLKEILPTLIKFGKVRVYCNGKYHTNEELMKLEVE